MLDDRDIETRTRTHSPHSTGCYKPGSMKSSIETPANSSHLRENRSSMIPDIKTGTAACQAASGHKPCSMVVTSRQFPPGVSQHNEFRHKPCSMIVTSRPLI
jgi:hypothetical protein